MESTESAVIELRQYALHPGKRDALISIFEREFIEPQERTGMQIIGQFRERNDPDLFVWLRGFPDMETRREALETFYTSDLWLAHRNAVNALMIDSDNVLLLRPAGAGAGFQIDNRPERNVGVPRHGLIVATIYPLKGPPASDFLAFFSRDARPVLESTGAEGVATLVTEPSPNTYPRLPVREGEWVFIWFARFPSASSYERHLADLAQSRRWHAIEQELDGLLAGPAQRLELIPTRRSALA